MSSLTIADVGVVLADLVLLDGNPLEDIANTRRIAAVIARGRVYQPLSPSAD